MTDKNIIDDYYTQIDSSESDSSKNGTEKKAKVVAKKKIISRKTKVVTKNEGATSINGAKKKIVKKQGLDENNTTKRDSEKVTVKKKGFVQKIEVVKKEDQTKKKIIVKKVDKSKNQDNTKKDVIKKDNISGTSNFKKHPSHNHKKGKKGIDTDSETEGKKSKLFFGEKKTRGRFRGFEEEKEVTFIRSNKVNKKQEKTVEDIKQNLVERKGETVIVPEVLSLKELSEKIGVILPKLMAEFMKNGMMVNINSKIDFESASIVSEAFDIKLEKDISGGASVEDILSGNITDLLKEDDSSKLKSRTPVISIMGHVDHGKTSLLDYIRQSKVASGEAGGITQSIGAYQVELDNGKITFLDTPGHEAFTVMRARGAKSTDIAILLVAADEGVKPQTIESINHAKEAGIPIIVAINKMDKVGANPDHVKGQLAELGLTPEDWGGDTPMVPVSAHTGFGIDDLLEIILLVAEMQELKANPDRAGIATVIESHLDSNLGPVATVLINTGTIKMGDNIVCQDTYGKIKVLKNYNNQSIKFAEPGEPVLVVGLDKVVDGGDIMQVVNSVELAKQKAEEYRTILAKQKLAGASGLALLMSKIKAGNLKQLKIILKADTNGSLEAIRGSLLKLSTPETTVQVIHAGVGSITESDILMGQGSEAILVGYNVGVLPTAKSTLESSGVEYIGSDIIYHITEKIERIITGMLDPKEVEIELGRAKVGGIFFTGKDFMILGLVLEPENKIENNVKVRIIRKKKMLGSGKIESLKSGTLEVKELEGPIECGIKLKTNVKIEIGDILEMYKIEIQK